ncbi:MAG: carboxylesterase family protein [Planctomycetota bacterium]|jgi:predicted peptidase
MNLSPDLSPGVHELLLDAKDLRYALKIPASRGSDPYPLVLALHWGGPVLPYTGRAILEGLVEPALGALDALIVAPDRDGESWANAKNEGNVLELLDLVEKAFPVDPKQTLLTGYSLGGIGTWYLAARHPRRFAGALPMAAPPPDDADEQKWELPLYVLHSRQDEIFDASEVEAFVMRMKERGAAVDLNLIDGVTHFDTGGFVEPLRDALPWIWGVWK